MATRYDLTYTRDEICTHALELCGRIYENQTPDSTLLDSAAKHLNMFIKAIQNEHSAPWAYVEGEVTLTADSETYGYSTPPSGPSATNKLIFIEDAYISRDAISTEYIPIEIVSKLQIRERFYYNDYSGEPEQVALTASGTFTFYPKPSIAYKFRYRGLAEDQEFDSGSDESGAPARWFMVFKYGLAAELAAHYRFPKGEIDDLRNQTRILFKQAKRGDNEFITNRRIKSAYPVRRRRCR